MSRLWDLLLGRRLATTEERTERVGPLAGVGLLGLDALASAAYGPEALLTVLLPLGTRGLPIALGLTGILMLLIVVVALSYRQTIEVYTSGGGAYTVAKENLGVNASLVAAASLLLDYLLNVAVAISAGVAALVSAIPSLLPHTLALCFVALVLLTLANLRGVRGTGALLLLPTYAFVLCLLALIAVGVAHWLHGSSSPSIAQPGAMPTHGAQAWLVVRAFANGCTAMTGIEAVSNGVPVFKEPAKVGARRTLTLIVGLLLVFLLGISLSCRGYGILATPPGEAGYQSILSQLAHAAFGNGPLYGVTIASIVAVLGLSANTSFADFPRVCRMLARDRFLPEGLVQRGRRLTFSSGIIVLALLSAALLWIFQGITDRLIPLFAIGALFAFTLSQVGMLAHWRRRHGGAARRGLLLNGAGTLATATLLLVVLVSKFTSGAWIALVSAGAMFGLFKAVHAHYAFIERATALDDEPMDFALREKPLFVVPVRRWDAVSAKALKLASSLGEDVLVIQVLTGDRDTEDLRERWQRLAVEPARAAGVKAPELKVHQSDYRQLFQPILDELDRLAKEAPERSIAVVVPQLVEQHAIDYLLHNQSAALLKALLLLRGRPEILLISVPWHLREWLPERLRLLRMRQRVRKAWHVADGGRS